MPRPLVGASIVPSSSGLWAACEIHGPRRRTKNKLDRLGTFGRQLSIESFPPRHTHTPQVGGRTMNMLCTVCSTSNLAPWGTAYVRCGQCNTVSDVTHIYTTTGRS